MGNDTALDVFKDLANFIWERADIGIIALERRDANLQLHVQGVLSIKSTSSRALKNDIASAIEWEEDNPIGGSIRFKALTNKGLHTLIGMCVHRPSSPVSLIIVPAAGIKECHEECHPKTNAADFNLESGTWKRPITEIASARSQDKECRGPSRVQELQSVSKKAAPRRTRYIPNLRAVCGKEPSQKSPHQEAGTKT
ncbi:hypothetical protein R1flu_022280 [Riccia fluitans]|uniref:Uncharacterized protein n=1 Tax=Riccia fluitans TaxID=41844 RepID=A0ABD1ZRT4_9MARC